MEQTEGKRRLSSAGEDASRECITKRLKSVEEQHSNSWHFMDSIDDASMSSLSRSTSLNMQSLSRSSSVDLHSFSRSASIGSSGTNDSALDSDAETPATTVPQNDDGEPKSVFVFPETVEMGSQRLDMDMFDEGECSQEGSANGQSARCKFLNQISRNILSMDEEQDEEFRHETNVVDVLTYVQGAEADTQTVIAQYLSSGSLEHAKLTMQNLHNFYHVSTLLNLKQLRNHCVKFCRANNQAEIITCFQGCSCQNDIKSESAAGYQRSESVLSNPDESDPPQYYIVFTEKTLSENQDKRKVQVLVIDTSQKRNVYHREVDKMRYFGEGLACCSFEVKGTPFVMVSGGKGKSSTSVMKYDVLLGRWDKCSKLLHGRSRHMMVTANSNSIFVFGGSEVSCIEEYSLKTNKWIERASLVTHIVSAVCKVYQNKIYIFGGKTPAGNVATSQCYDTDTHKIERLTDLPCAFDGGQAVVLNDRIYIATDQGHMLRFNPNTGYARLCTQQPIQRKHFGMFVKHNRIYLVGGVICNDEDPSTRIPQYRYNADKDVWVEKYKLCYSFPVFASCIINYEKKCCVIPFNEHF